MIVYFLLVFRKLDRLHLIGAFRLLGEIESCRSRGACQEFDR